MRHATRSTLILNRSQVASLLDPDSCIEAVETAFRAHGEGGVAAPVMTGVHVERGGFHIKAGVLALGREYFAAKTNANYPGNRDRTGLPTIQGTLVLHDTGDGYPLAVMDSIEISIQRTGAATAVAAKHLARPDSSAVAVCGCGEQGRVQVRSLARVVPLRRVWLTDVYRSRAEALAAELGRDLGIDAEVADDFRLAARGADICITCTPSERYVLGRADVMAGTFVAGVGADNPHKRELEPALLAGARVLVDVLVQCAESGDLHHAIEAGAMTTADVHAELGAVVAGRARGRTDRDEIIVFDSTGMALQDVAVAAAVYERAMAAGIGQAVDLAS
jgi:ornithine cyclodeaminase/alanine dehydrogenase-like protein (mu-crystallin family)